MSRSVRACVAGGLLLAAGLAPQPALADLGPTAKQVVVVPRGHSWAYHDLGSDLGTAWRARTYDDSGWMSGAGVLGYGSDMITTPVSFGLDPEWKHPTTYFRTRFNLADAPSSIRRVMLGVNYDDGFVLYLNGTEVARVNMPAGDILYTTRASTEWAGERFQLVDLTPHVGLLTAGENVLAAEVHQKVRNSPDLVWDAKLQVTRETSLITRGPYLQLTTETSVTIRWRSDVANIGRIRYGTSLAALNQAFTESLSGTEHVVTLTGLAPNTRYYYDVGTSSGLVLVGASPEYTFRTHPVRGSTTADVRLWVLGDSGQFNPLQLLVRDSYLAYPDWESTSAVLLLGDNAYQDGRDDEYQSGFFEPFGRVLRRVPAWPARGNHENVGPDYFAMFTLPTAGQAGGVPSGSEAYYSFDFGNVHIVCLDSDTSSRAPDGPMFTWLRGDLAATTQPWIIAYWHHAPYTKGTHDSDDDLDSSGRMREMREIALPILEDHGVDLVLAGHSHGYERSFLIDGHYGPSATFDENMLLNAGNGSWPDGAPYTKPSAGRAPHEGTVYVVAGSSSLTMPAPLNHPAMRVGYAIPGSMVIDVKEIRLDARFLGPFGTVYDEFTILKGTTVDVDNEGPDSVAMAPGRLHVPTPSRSGATIRYTLAVEGPATLTVYDLSGRLVRELVRSDAAAGSVTWDGRDRAGRPVASGTYVVVLRGGPEVLTRKMVVVR